MRLEPPRISAGISSAPRAPHSPRRVSPTSVADVLPPLLEGDAVPGEEHRLEEAEHEHERHERKSQVNVGCLQPLVVPPELTRALVERQLSRRGGKPIVRAVRAERVGAPSASVRDSSVVALRPSSESDSTREGLRPARSRAEPVKPARRDMGLPRRSKSEAGFREPVRRSGERVTCFLGQPAATFFPQPQNAASSSFPVSAWPLPWGVSTLTLLPKRAQR